jgi:predicted Zn-dependent protease
MTRGGGDTLLSVRSRVTGSTTWARNRVDLCATRRDVDLHVTRDIGGAVGRASVTQFDDAGLRQAVENAERVLQVGGREFEWHGETYFDDPILTPTLWSDATHGLDAEARTALAEHLMAPVETAGFLSAGALHIAAESRATLAPRGTFRYYRTTSVACSTTARDAKGTTSGWAGINHYDLRQIDPAAIAARALDKCRRAQNPVAIEPGRYTAILEPQAMADLMAPLFEIPMNMDRFTAELGMGPWASRPGFSKINEHVLDSRLTVRADPMDADGGFLPFDVQSGVAYHPVDWISRGVLRALSYGRRYALRELGKELGLPNSGSFRLMSVPGTPTVTVETMIANTERGLLVTRFYGVRVVDDASMLCTGFTRDGLWLIERGKIAKPVKNFRFKESPLFILNNVDEIGVPTRVFAPDRSYVAPAMRVRDFSFAGLADAV